MYLRCPDTTNGEPIPENLFKDEVDPNIFMKKTALVLQLLLTMKESHILPLKHNWLAKVYFGGDLKHESHMHIYCAYSKPDKILKGLGDEFNERMLIVLLDVMTCLKTKTHARLNNNKYWQGLLALQNLKLKDMLALVMDSLSHAFDVVDFRTHFSVESSPEGKKLCDEYINLICDDNGNLRDVFNNFGHSNFTFLPVRDLDKPTSGRFGVKSITYFLEDETTEFAMSVLKAETALRLYAYDIMKSKFPNELYQFVSHNQSLLLMRLANSLLVAQAVHVDNMHGFPHSQYGCFIALNCNQRCHVYLDKSTDDFQFVTPEMCVGVPNIFVSALYEHSGVSCACDSNCSVALTWYQDCVLEHSSGSVPKYSTNANSFGLSFAALCQSTIPCVHNCGGCRLELLLTKENIYKQVCDFSVCTICEQVRCVNCAKLTLRSSSGSEGKVGSVNEFLERCQSITQSSKSFWKPLCTHLSADMRSAKSADIMKCLMTEKQLSSYSNNAIHILENINVCNDVRFQDKSFEEVLGLLKCKCMRAFGLSLCMYVLYTNELAESVCDFFTGTMDERLMKSQCTAILLHSRDLDYVTQRADKFITLVSSWLLLGMHLRCTTKKKTSDSVLCACSVKCSLKPSKEYTKAFKAAHLSSTLMIENVSDVFAGALWTFIPCMPCRDLMMATTSLPQMCTLNSKIF